MTTGTTSADVKAIQDRQANGRGAVIVAAGQAYESATGQEFSPQPEHLTPAIEAAMMALVEHWRAEADIWEAGKKRGSVGTAKEIRAAASRLAGFAVGLTTRPVISIDPAAGGGAGLADAAQIRNLGTYEIVSVAGTEAVDAGSLTETFCRCLQAGHPSPCSNAACESSKYHDSLCLPCATATSAAEPCAHPDDALGTRKDSSVLCTQCQSVVRPGDGSALVIIDDPAVAIDSVLGEGTVGAFLAEAAQAFAPAPPPRIGSALVIVDDPWISTPVPAWAHRAPGFVPSSHVQEIADALPDGDPVRAAFTDFLASSPDEPIRVHRPGCGFWGSGPSGECACFDDSHPPQCDCGRPECATLSLTSDPFSLDPQPSEEQSLRDIIGPLGAATLAVVDSPFTSPAASVPWLNRPAVAALPYTALPALAAATKPREHVSHSYVETYEGCSLSALLRDASRDGKLGPQRPGWSMIGGSAFHGAVEAIERAWLSGVELFPEWMTFFESAIQATAEPLAGTPYADSATWYVSNRGKEGFDWWRVEGARMLDLYVKHHTPTWRAANPVFRVGDTTPVIEYPYEMTLRSLDGERGLTAQGFVDVARLDMTTYSLTVYDYKTGSRDPETTFQLGEYGHALLMAMSIPAEPADRPILGSYWLARKGIYTPPVKVLQRHPLEELQYRYDAAARGTSARVFGPKVSNLCKSCGSVDYCPTQAGRS